MSKDDLNFEDLELLDTALIFLNIDATRDDNSKSLLQIKIKETREKLKKMIENARINK
jgi:hypothetical protein